MPSLAYALLVTMASSQAIAQSNFGTAATAPVDTTTPEPKAAKAPRQRSISVVLPFVKDKASDFVAGALLDAGYQIASTSPALIETAELPRYGNTAGLVIRVNTIGFASGDSTRVVVTGTFFNDMALRLTRVLAGNQALHDMHAGESQPVESYSGGLQAKLWKRLSDVADAVTKAGGGHSLAAPPTR